MNECCNQCGGNLQPGVGALIAIVACAGCGREIPAEPGIVAPIDRMEHVPGRPSDFDGCVE